MRVILPYLIEEKYRSTGDFTINNHWTPSLSISHTKFIVLKNILEHQNDTKLPTVLNLQASEVSSEVQKYP